LLPAGNALESETAATRLASPAGPASRPGIDGVVDGADLGGDPLRQGPHLRLHRLIVARGDRRARFLHSTIGIGADAPCAFEIACGDPHRVGGLHPFVELMQRRRGECDRGVGLGLRPGLAVGRLPRRLERPFVGVDRAREGEPVVALLDRFMGLLHRGQRRAEWLGGELLGAGGASTVDGALRAIDFFLRRFGTGGQEEEGADRDGDTTHRPEV
jgi:hypothetical protein